jgi:hypothetical protein
VAARQDRRHRLTTRVGTLCAALLLGTACSDTAAPQSSAVRDTEAKGAGQSFAGPTLTTVPVRLLPGGEILLVCQTFPLHNDDWLFVDGVTFSAIGVHHSNWFVTPEGAYPGPEGSADCAEFGFGLSMETPTMQNQVLFSQSPEAADETQSFAEGAAFALAPHSQILVAYHVMNTSADVLATGVSAALRMRDESSVKIRLQSGGGIMGLLALPPLSRSRFYSDCTFATPPTFKSYFMLPHYHNYGIGMQLELIGGTRDGEVVWQNEGAIGEALGTKIAPAIDFTGATGFRFGCTYENTTSRTIFSGGTAEDEMCSFYVSTDAPVQFYGVASPGFGSPERVDQGIDASGVHTFSVEGCAILN